MNAIELYDEIYCSGLEWACLHTAGISAKATTLTYAIKQDNVSLFQFVQVPLDIAFVCFFLQLLMIGLKA